MSLQPNQGLPPGTELPKVPVWWTPIIESLLGPFPGPVPVEEIDRICSLPTDEERVAAIMEWAESHLS